MLTRTDRRRFPVLLAVIAVLALAMPMLFSTVQAQEGSAPGQPTGLEATATHDSVTLTWDDPGDDSITGYVILRRVPGVDPEGQFSELVSNTGTDATTYTDDTVSAETRYTYRIKAINEHGVSERSRWSHINVPAAPEAAEGDEQDGEDDDGAPGGPGKRANVSEGGTDCPDDNTTTCEVDVGGKATGEISSVTDQDWFQVELEADTRYQIDLEGEDTSRGTLGDPFLALRHPCCVNTIVGSRDQGVGDNARLIYTLAPPYSAGVFYLTVEGAASTTGTYTLSVIVLGANGNSEADTDFPGTTATTGRVEVGASATGNIGTGGDQDWFKVVLEADKTYRIDMNGSNGGGGTLNDTRLSNIRDSSGNEISGTGNDDIDALNSNLDSQTTFTPTEAGAYYLVALGGGGTVTGTYTLSVREVTSSDDCLADTDTTCEVDVGGSVTGNIETEDDEDWFKVVLEADKTYQIDMKGEYGGGGTLEDPLLDNIRDSSGTGISDTGNDDVDADNDNYDSRTTFTPTTAGAYYLVATTADDSGTYTLSVREIQCTLNEGDIWCGVVTVAEVKSGENLLAHGFADTTSPATLDAGSLAGNPDDRTFPVGDNEYTVQGLYVATGGDRDGWLVFWITDVGHLDDHDEGILVLTIDGVDTPRAFDGNQGVLGGLYQWDADLDWSMETDVTVRLQTPDDFSAGTTTTGEVDVGGSVTGNIETVADYGDWFKVELEADTRYQIDLEGADTGRGTLVDPGIELLANSIGNTVPNTGGSDSGVGKNDRTIYTPSTSDAYYVVVQPLDTGLGTYTLSVIVLGANGNSEADTDFPDTTSTTGRVEVGASATGNIHTNGNRDAFRVDLEAGKVYQVDLEGAGTNKGSLDDPQLFAIADSTGSSISGGDNNDISSSNLNSRVTFTPTDAGSYYVLVRGNGTSTGTYTVTVIQQAAADTTAPSVSSATVSAAGAAIDIVFDEPLDETSTPSFTAFIAGISGIQTDRAVPSNVAVSGDTVTLTIRSGNTIAAGAIVTLAYTAPSTNALADASGNEVESFTGTDAIAVLNRPAAPVVTLTAGNEKLTAMWAAPANGGSAITGYDVEWKTAAQTWAQAGTAGQSDTAAADATDHEITGLTNNTEYTVRVRAANDAWDGPWSTEASETPAAPDDDCSATTTTTCAVDVGGSATGTLETAGDADWFKVVLEADTRYQIDLEGADTGRGTLVDPAIENLAFSFGTTVPNTSGSDNGVGKNDRTIFTAGVAGAYYVVVQPSDTGLGTYTLSVIVLGANGNSEADADFPETTSTGGRVEVGASATGNIETRTDRDWFKVDLEEGKLYQIDLEGAGGGGGALEDPHLRNIRDSSGTEISGTENDDVASGNSDSRVIFTPTADGAYYLVASGYDSASNTGTYTLSVTELETRTTEGGTDFAASIATLGRVEVDGSATGEIDPADDIDWFRVVLEAGKTYVFDLKGTETGVGTLPDPLLLLWDSPGLRELARDNDGADGSDSRLEYTATASGIHYLDASAAGNASSNKGTYTLSVREVACTLNEGDIWCGVVTVGDIEYSDSLFARGYINVTGLSGGSFKGDTDITVGSNDYTFTGIYVPVTGSFEDQLIFRMDVDFTSDEKDALELHIDVDGVGSTWPMSEFADSTSEGQMIRQGEDFDWDSATTVTARLRPLTPGPTITDVEVTSEPVLETDTYGAGETIEVSVTFSEAVDATSDTDFVLSVAGAKRALLLRGSGTATLVFGYTVVSSDEDTNGIWIGDETRTLVGNRNGEPQNGTITSVATGVAADLDHTELGTDSGHKVDGSRTTENVAPSFSSSATISVAENQTTVVTVLATDSDTDDDITGYAITGGADEGFFSIGATSGALTFEAAPNYEDAQDQGTNNTYVVDVTATSGAGTRVKTATQTITVTVTDVDTEAPGKPGTPTVSAGTPTVSAGSPTSLRVNWSAPSNAGPPITGYDVRHRTSSPEGSWTEKNVPSIAAVIESLSENTSYDVQVRATNAEGTGAWSDSGNGTTDAAAVLPTLSVANASATEGSLIRFPLTLSAASGEIVSVQCSASFESGDTAAAADLASDNSTATIQIGSTSGSCAISSAQDTIDEENETFTVTLSSPSSNAQLATDPTAKGTINDDDDPPTVSVADVSGAEGTALTFTVTLSAESGKTVTVDYATSAETGDTATSGTDFTAKTSTTLTFDPGQEDKTFTVQTTDDTDIEGDETFTVTLSNPSNATISDATAKGTIENDDEAALDVLVSNYPDGSGSDFSLNFVQSGNSQRHYIAQTFTAGAGFTLTAVDIPFKRVPDNSRVTVSLHARNGSKPGTYLADLDLSGALAVGDNTFAAPAGTALAAGSYFVRVRWRSGDTNNLKMTDGPDEETSAESGWSIEDRSQYSASGSSWSNWNQQFAMRVRGTIDGVPRVATGGVRIESDPDAHDSYGVGEEIEVAVGFTDDVTVDTMSGTPRVELTVGSNTRYADYSASDSSADELAFLYEVTADDHDQDGVSIDADALELNGGAIHKDGDTSTNAVLGHAALDADSDHRVNRDPFIVSDGVSVISDPQLAADTYVLGEVIEIEVEFSAAVDAATGTDFVLSVSGPKRAAAARLGHEEARVRLHRGGERRRRQRHLDRGPGPDAGRQPRWRSPERRDHERGHGPGGGPRP